MFNGLFPVVKERVDHPAVRETLTAVVRLPASNRGAEGIRTLDPLVANQVLSQLSYSPVAPIRAAHLCGPEWS